MSDRVSPDRSENARQNGSRPFSRRGTMENGLLSGSDIGESMTNAHGMRSSGGQFTARPPSVQNLIRRNTSRLSSATNHGSKAGQSLLGVANINVLDRPITQQGVSGLRTAGTRGSQFRQVLDKRYYEGLIRMKMKDINTELGRLNGEIELESQQQAASQVYEKRVREVASELTKLQGLLADYNVVIDKVNTSADKSAVDSESDDLKAENERRSADLDELYGQCRKREQEIHRLEAEIQSERDTTRKLIDEMNDSDRSKYDKLKNLNEELLKEIEQYQHQLDGLTSQKLQLEERVSTSQMKRETVRLYHKLREREERKATLLEEERTRSTPAQEREKLLQKVKEDNAEIAAIDRQINQINEDIKKKKEDLEMIEQDLEDSQTDKHQKFKELKKREDTLEQFLSTFQESRNTEAVKIDELEKKIVGALQQMSKKLRGNIKPIGRDEFNIMKETLSLKEDELNRSKLTVDELNVKRQQLSTNMKKVDDLERRIQEEILAIQERTVTMTEEMKTFSDIDGLKTSAREKQESLRAEKTELNAKKTRLRKRKDDLQEENDKLLKHLNENETYVQLNNLEKKLQLLEQNNAAAKEFILSKKTETEYELLKESALQSVSEFNQLLIAAHAK